MHHAVSPRNRSTDPSLPWSRPTAVRIETLALMLILLFTSCRRDAREPSADPGTSGAAASGGAEVGNPDSLQPSVSAEPANPVQEPDSPEEHRTVAPDHPPVDEPGGSTGETETSPDPDAPLPPEGSGDASPATPKEGDAQATTAELREYPLQDNPLAGCPLCHVDVEDELVGTLHFKEKIGCITCHGPSEGHLADENNEVKPDEVFARPDVDRLCERCHECFRPKPEKPELTAEGQRKVCIDCHGPHDCALAADAGPASSP